MPEIHLKIKRLYYFYIEKLLRSNLLCMWRLKKTHFFPFAKHDHGENLLLSFSSDFPLLRTVAFDFNWKKPKPLA